MKLQFLGTGTFGAKRRALTSFLINDEILFDAGGGTVRGLQNYGADFSKIKYLIITHFHIDHLPDAMNLIMRRYIQKITMPLTVIGPPGTKQAIQDALQFTMGSFKYLGDTKFIEIADDEVEVDGYKIVARTVLHGDCIPASGYEIIAKNTRAGFSGDSANCQGLDKIVANSDVLFVDSTMPGKGDDMHLNLDGALEYARTFPDKKFYLVHRGDYEIPADLPSNVYLPDDGAIINL
jgi:ribonuclease BN (tRNA processing enzyme)